MLQIPPTPTWEGFHPLIVHFPIALLLVAPLFAFLGLLGIRRSPSKGRPFLMAALLLMILGTGAAFLAAETGEAAARMAPETPQIRSVLEHHEGLAEGVEIISSALTAALAGILFLPRLLHRELSGSRLTVLLVLFLVACGAGALIVANTAHAGGRLVHEFGVKAALASPASAPLRPQRD